MEVTGLALILLLSATLTACREYHYVDQWKNWTEAQSYCRENFADLAAIETEQDWAKVRGMIGNAPFPHAWIGLYDDAKNWRWSLDNTSFYNADHSFLTLAFDNNGGKQYCGMLKDKNTVDDMDCDGSLPSLCYDESSNTYVPVNDRMTWESARSHCREHHTDLAILRNQQDLNTAQTQIDTSSWWIGLSREGWKWSDQTNFSFSNWATYQPYKDNHCGSTSVNGWSSTSCDTSGPSICSVPIERVLNVEVKTNGNVDLHDPLVQAAILSQVKKDMKARGIKQDFKLSWRNQPTGNVFKQRSTYL